jgi:hypothetical protein
VSVSAFGGLIVVPKGIYASPSEPAGSLPIILMLTLVLFVLPCCLIASASPLVVSRSPTNRTFPDLSGGPSFRDVAKGWAALDFADETFALTLEPNSFGISRDGGDRTHELRLKSLPVSIRVVWNQRVRFSSFGGIAAVWAVSRRLPYFFHT